MAGLFKNKALAEKYSKLGLTGNPGPGTRSRSKTPPEANPIRGNQSEQHTNIQQGCMRIPAKYLNNGDGFSSTIVGNRFPAGGGGG